MRKRILAAILLVMIALNSVGCDNLTVSIPGVGAPSTTENETEAPHQDKNDKETQKVDKPKDTTLTWPDQTEPQTKPEAPIAASELSLGSNRVSVKDITTGAIVCFVAPEDGEYTFAFAEGEKNGEARYYDGKAAQDRVSFPQTVILKGGEKVYYAIFTRNWKNDTVDIEVTKTVQAISYAGAIEAICGMTVGLAISHESDTPTFDAAAAGVATGYDSILTVAGWMATSGGIYRYEWSLDGVNWNRLTSAGSSSTGDSATNAAFKEHFNALGFTNATTRAFFLGDKAMTIDLSAYRGELVHVYIAATPLNDKSTRLPMLEITNLHVPQDPNYIEPWDENKEVVVHQTLDELRVNDKADYNRFFQPGQVDSWNHVADLKVTEKQLIYCGWLALNGGVGTFGYRIDGGEYVFSDKFAIVAELPVVDAAVRLGADSASRMRIVIDLSEVWGDGHTVQVVYRNPEGRTLLLCEFIVNREIGPELPDPNGQDDHYFQSDVNSQAVGTDLRQSDLAELFNISYALGQSEYVCAGYYSIAPGNFISMVAQPTGAYAYSVNLIGTSAPGFASIFVRGVAGMSAENQYFGFDGNDSTASSHGGAGIYLNYENGSARINIKSFRGYEQNRHELDANIFYVPVSGMDFTIVDDGPKVTILQGGSFVAQITISGTRDFGISGVAKNALAETVTIQLADGTVHTVENAVVAASHISDIGIATRTGGLNFTSVSLMPADTVEIPAMSERPVEPDKPFEEYFVRAENLFQYGKNDIDASIHIDDYGRPYVHMLPTGSDPWLPPVINTTVAPYVVLRYRTNSTLDGQIFAGNGAGPTGADSVNLTWSEGGWKTMVLNLYDYPHIIIKDNSINYLRLDIFNSYSAGDYFDLEYIAFFGSLAAAEAFAKSEPVDDSVPDIDNPPVETPPEGEYDMWDANKDIVVYQSFDELRKNDTFEGLFTPGQSPGWNFVANLDGSTTSLTYWGWVAIKGDVGTFGYRIDGGCAIWDNSFTHATEDGVISAAISCGGDTGSRMLIHMDVSGYYGDGHTVEVLYRNPEGRIVMLNRFELNRAETGLPPVDDSNADAFITFADVANRVEFSTVQQVWHMNGITLTNSKATSTTDVRDSIDPIRCYKNSDVSIEYPGMTRLIITCATELYAENLVSTAFSSGVVTLNGTVVIIDLDRPTDRVLFSNLAGQVRISQIEVHADAQEQPPVTPTENWTVNLSDYADQPCYMNTWPAAAISTPLFVLGYNNTIHLGYVDLSKYTAVRITYCCDGSYVTENSFLQSSSLAIGLKSENSSYGQEQDNNFSGDIAHTDMVFSSSYWGAGQRDAFVNLLHVDYAGDVYVTVHNPQGTTIAITGIEFLTDVIVEEPEPEPPAIEPGDTTYKAYTGEFYAINEMVDPYTPLYTVYFKQGGVPGTGTVTIDGDLSGIYNWTYTTAAGIVVDNAGLNFNIYTGTGGLTMQVGRVTCTLTTEKPVAPTTNALILGHNTVEVTDTWNGTTVTFTAPETGTYHLYPADGENNAGICSVSEMGSEWIELPYMFTLAAGESISLVVLTLDWSADAIDLIITAEKVPTPELTILTAEEAGLKHLNIDAVTADNYSASVTGWMGFHDFLPIDLGWSVDGGAITWGAGYIDPNSPDINIIMTYAGPHSFRYSISADLTEYAYGEHTVAYYALQPDGITACIFYTQEIVTKNSANVGNSTVSLDSAVNTDLSSVFTFTQGLDADSCSYRYAPYKMAGINQLIATMDGTYEMTLTNFRSSGLQGTIVLRGNPSPNFGDANYYGTDNSPFGIGCAGVYATILDENGTPTLKINVRGKDAGGQAVLHLYSVAMSDYNLRIVDDNTALYFYEGDTLLATVNLSGFDKGYATQAIVTLHDGTCEILDDVCVAASAASDIGFVARANDLTFDALTLNGMSA